MGGENNPLFRDTESFYDQYVEAVETFNNLVSSGSATELQLTNAWTLAESAKATYVSEAGKANAAANTNKIADGDSDSNLTLIIIIVVAAVVFIAIVVGAVLLMVKKSAAKASPSDVRNFENPLYSSAYESAAPSDTDV